MKKNVKKLSVTVMAMAVLLVFLLSACTNTSKGSSETQDSKPSKQSSESAEPDTSTDPVKPVVGFSNYASIPYFLDMEASAKMETVTNGGDFYALRCEGDAAKQLAQMEDLIAKGVNVLLAEVADPGSAEKYFADLKKKGITIVCLDLNTPGSDYWIASDDFEIGRICAEEAVNYLKEKNGSPKGKIVMLAHKTATNMQNRCSGFREYLSQFPDINIIDERFPAKFDVPTMMTLTEDILQLYQKGDIDMIFASNQTQLEGANAAVMSAKRDDIILVGVDDSPTIREALLDPNSPTRCTVVQDPITMGKQAAKVGMEILKGNRPAETTYRPPLILVTKETVKDYIAETEATYKELEPYYK